MTHAGSVDRSFAGTLRMLGADTSSAGQVVNRRILLYPTSPRSLRSAELQELGFAAAVTCCSRLRCQGATTPAPGGLLRPRFLFLFPPTHNDQPPFWCLSPRLAMKATWPPAKHHCQCGAQGFGVVQRHFVRRTIPSHPDCACAGSA